MNEKTAKYLAIQEMASLLRETTIKELVPVESDSEDRAEPLIKFEYGNMIFSKKDHETIKRAFLRLCSEL